MMSSTQSIKQKLLEQINALTQLINNLDHSLKRWKHKELIEIVTLKNEILKVSDESSSQKLTDYSFRLSEIENRLLAHVKKIQQDGENQEKEEV